MLPSLKNQVSLSMQIMNSLNYAPLFLKTSQLRAKYSLRCIQNWNNDKQNSGKLYRPIKK